MENCFAELNIISEKGDMSMDNFVYYATTTDNTIESNVVTHKYMRDYMIQHFDELAAAHEDYKKAKEKSETLRRERENQHYINLIKDVFFKKDRCTILWADDTTTRVTWDHHEPWDSEKAILYAIVTKMMNKTAVRKILEKYVPKGDKALDLYIESIDYGA